SKRHGATAVGDYQHLGIVPEAMVNFLVLLGWSPGEDREIMPLEQMIELFSASGLQKKAAVFDTQKLEWMNGQYLSAMPIEKLEPRVTPAILAAGVATPDQLRGERYLALLELLRVRARTIHDVVRQAVPYLSDSIAYDADAVAKGWKDPAESAVLLQAVLDKLDAAGDWTVDGLEAALRALAEERGTTAGKIFQPMRVALTGMSVSPSIFDVLVTLGREKSLGRMRAAIARLTTP
ncbi:MAG: glutamate--tRNA ligase, partial [Gemmatimonadaceae bacterium]|nr:glutamate--tRNA ligase [Gemmatimonadaceae bacterium]